jgi:hypothetical protein
MAVSDQNPPHTAASLLDVLIPLCDDLLGEPPALIAWGPDQLAKRIAEGLAENGLALVPTALPERIEAERLGWVESRDETNHEVNTWRGAFNTGITHAAALVRGDLGGTDGT